MKTSRAVLAAGLMAGLSALPLTASAADAVPAPNGSASAAALQLTVSTVPLKSIVNSTGVLNWQQVTAALSQLQQAICGTSVCSTLGLQIPTDLPDSLTVRVAQAEDNATLNSLATDVVAGHSDSTPVATDWKTLNLDINSLESLVAGFINQGTQALASGNATALTSFLASVSSKGLSLNLGPLGVANLDVLGTVQANLGQKGATDNPFASANAVSITGIGGQLAKKDGFVTVDPFQACAASAKLAGACKASGAQVSASNNIVAVGLPDLLGTSANTAALTSLASTLQSLIDTLSKAIADPGNAGSILTGAASSLPAPLSGPVGTLGGLLGGAAGTVTGTTAGTPVDLSALKLWDTKLSDTLASINALISALAGLALPDVTKLVTSADDLATAQTVPVAGGGVASMATSTLGSLSILPIGGTLAGVINTAISTVKGATGVAALKPVTADTALLNVQGIQASADASVGPNGAEHGTSGLRTVSVLGQTIDLDKLTTGTLLAPGTELHHVFTIPGLGSVTLDITRGIEQVVADTPTYREVHMAALQITLTNGAIGCQTSTCTDPLGAAGTSNGTRVASTSSGIAALGPDGTQMVAAGFPVAIAAASMSLPTPTGSSNSGGSQAGLPKTGLFGGNALPAGLVLIAVAISLRVLPSLRLKLRRVR